MLEELLFPFGAVIVLSAGLSFLAHRLKQPLILAYIATGALAGPWVLSSFANAGDLFGVLAQCGVAFLLFTVGLGLDWRSVKNVGGVALAAGAAKVVVTGAVAWLVAQAFGFPATAIPYIAAAFAFSSTIVVVKLLTDKEEQDTLHGRIAVGILLVQDVVAMFLLLTLSASGQGVGMADAFSQALLKGVVLLPILWLISAKVVPRIVAYAARSQELLLMFALAWCFFVAGMLAWLGFGLELGALIAGVMLSGTAFEAEIEGRVRPLRDFFLVAFFILLGTHFHADTVVPLLLPALAFIGVVFLVKPLVVVTILRSLGHHPRTGFLTGTAIGQISEFSFLILAVGVAAGQVPESFLSLATTVALVTIALSSYLITHNEGVYAWLAPAFKMFEPSNPLDTQHKHIRAPRAVLFGVHRVGAVALETVRNMGGRYLIVDFNPEVVRELSELGEPVVYGDAGDDSFLSSIHAEKARLAISTIPDAAVSLGLLAYLRAHRFAGTAIVSARTAEEAKRCYEAGATYVIVPNLLGGQKFRELLQKSGASRRSWERIAREHQDYEG